MIFQFSINLITAAVTVAVIGVTALCAYIFFWFMREREDPFDPRWMDREKWEQSRK